MLARTHSLPVLCVLPWFICSFRFVSFGRCVPDPCPACKFGQHEHSQRLVQVSLVAQHSVEPMSRGAPCTRNNDAIQLVGNSMSLEESSSQPAAAGIVAPMFHVTSESVGFPLIPQCSSVQMEPTSVPPSSPKGMGVKRDSLGSWKAGPPANKNNDADCQAAEHRWSQNCLVSGKDEDVGDRQDHKRPRKVGHTIVPPSPPKVDADMEDPARPDSQELRDAHARQAAEDAAHAATGYLYKVFGFEDDPFGTMRAREALGLDPMPEVPPTAPARDAASGATRPNHLR